MIIDHDDSRYDLDEDGNHCCCAHWCCVKQRDMHTACFFSANGLEINDLHNTVKILSHVNRLCFEKTKHAWRVNDGDSRSVDDHIQDHHFHHHDNHRYHHFDYNVVPPVTAAQSPRAVLKSVDSNCLRHDFDDDDHDHHADNNHHPTDFVP